MVTATKVIASGLILVLSLQMCAGSAIPIWEFLTRNEKMSYLYSTFAQLVSVHCKATATTSSLPVNQCKRNLLAYGYEKLQTFSDMQLDTFDPYQRGASELIWSSIMRDHPSSTLITTRKPFPTPPASSIVILTHQQPINRGQSAPPPQQQPHAAASAPAPHSPQYPKNPIFEADAEHKHQYAMDMDIAYGYPGAANPQAETFNAASQPQQTYLTGPLVFRVRPDGTPVEGDQRQPLPRDDDLEEFRAASSSGSSSETSVQNNNSNSNNDNNNNSGSAHHNKHRKIATISALKQRHLATLALQQQLQPPLEHGPQQKQQQRLRRQFQPATSGGYFYGRGQA